MDDSPRLANPEDDPSDNVSTPKWVKVFGIAALVLVLLFVASHLIFGGFAGHGAPSAEAGSGASRP